jgi:hypothetical protein
MHGKFSSQINAAQTFFAFGRMAVLSSTHNVMQASCGGEAALHPLRKLSL